MKAKITEYVIKDGKKVKSTRIVDGISKDQRLAEYRKIKESYGKHYDDKSSQVLALRELAEKYGVQGEINDIARWVKGE